MAERDEAPERIYLHPHPDLSSGDIIEWMWNEYPDDVDGAVGYVRADLCGDIGREPAAERRSANPVANALADDLRKRGMCGTIFVDGFGDEAICMIPQPCERHARPSAEAERLVSALDAGWHVLAGNVGEGRYRAIFYKGSLFETGPRVDATEASVFEALDVAAGRALEEETTDED